LERRLPRGFGFTRLRPPLHVFGTEEQKAKFLPPIAKGEAVWYEAFTELDAGSDEANIGLRAIADGDFFVFNDQKHFISARGPADFLYTLARTADSNPKHRGLSLFLIDAHTRGISYRPLPTFDNITVEIFFDNVRVHKNAILGQMIRGFYHAMVTFEFERTNTKDPAIEQRALEELVQFAKDEKRNGKPLIEDPEFRVMLAERAIPSELAWRGSWCDAWFFNQCKRLGSPPPLTATLRGKVDAAPAAKEFIDSLGLYGQLERNNKHAKFERRAHRNWHLSSSMHPRGTIEITKVVMAGRGLGLPRIPAKFNKEIAKSLTEKE
jgi:alkylation response protein AidB-like acyl-CoA dehydrogenase